METMNQKAVLAELLQTYKRNREGVSLKELKTKYRTGYETLCKNLCLATSEYVKAIILDDLYIHGEYQDVTAAIINTTIKKSGLLKKFRHAVFNKMDLTLLEKHAIELKEMILADLEPFYSQHICLYITEDCLQEPFNTPTFYNEVTGLFFDGSKWVKKKHQNDGILLFLREKQENATS